ncbi:hypothetical protein BDZ89DRAFT_1074620 [Hymenopellis radicata]|nr:hypothetical protein BDZ89DRAFT_1074620 [Hymenopellis radicata]
MPSPSSLPSVNLKATSTSSYSSYGLRNFDGSEYYCPEQQSSSVFLSTNVGASTSRRPTKPVDYAGVPSDMRDDETPLEVITLGSTRRASELNDIPVQQLEDIERQRLLQYQCYFGGYASPQHGASFASPLKPSWQALYPYRLPAHYSFSQPSVDASASSGSNRRSSTTHSSRPSKILSSRRTSRPRTAKAH